MNDVTREILKKISERKTLDSIAKELDLAESDTFTVKVKDINDLESDWATLDVTIPIGRINLNNNAPNPPSISGPTSGKIDTTYDYEVTVTDPDEDDGLLRLELDFGDGIIAEDCGCSRVWQNGEVIDMSHRWKKLVHIQFQEE